MHVLVTGGAGFIGSHVVDSLLADGHEVTVLDNFDDFYERFVKEGNIRSHRNHRCWRLIETDIRDETQLALRLTADYDAIVHLAAKAGVRPSIDNPLLYQDVNVRGTENLLEFARSRHVPHFVFGSSSSVYGVNPRCLGARTTSCCSRSARTRARSSLASSWVSLRSPLRHSVRGAPFFTVYGPRQRPDLAIDKFARLIAAESGFPFRVESLAVTHIVPLGIVSLSVQDMHSGWVRRLNGVGKSGSRQPSSVTSTSVRGPE